MGETMITHYIQKTNVYEQGDSVVTLCSSYEQALQKIRQEAPSWYERMNPGKPLPSYNEVPLEQLQALYQQYTVHFSSWRGNLTIWTLPNPLPIEQCVKDHEIQGSLVFAANGRRLFSQEGAH